jgi:hypothetical protein
MPPRVWFAESTDIVVKGKVQGAKGGQRGISGKNLVNGEYRRNQEGVVQVEQKFKKIKNMLVVWLQVMWYGMGVVDLRCICKSFPIENRRPSLI